MSAAVTGSTKGKSLLVSIKDYVALDVETTGLSARNEKIIEIGLVRVRNGVEVECYSTLIHPGREVSAHITQLTGITNKMLSTAPSIEDVLEDVLAFIGNDVIVGHNVNFDIGFMQAACMEVLNVGFTNDFADTMRFSRRYFQELPNHRLGTLVCSFCVEQDQAHRALADAQATSRCYRFMCDQVEQGKKSAVRQTAEKPKKKAEAVSVKLFSL